MRAIAALKAAFVVPIVGLMALAVADSSATGAATPTPAFVQAVSAHGPGKGSLALVPTLAVSAGNRLIVEVGVWSGSSASASSVTDSAGNLYTELLHYRASDGTELSVWSAPITAGGGTKPTITVKPSATADTGAVALEYSGLSTASDATAVDVMSNATGTTASAAAVASGATTKTNAPNELSLGLYVDSGFRNSLTPGSGYAQRANVAPDGDIELLAEDRIVAAAGSTSNATAGTGAGTPWLMADIVFRAGAAGPPTPPAAPANVVANAGNGSATVTWNAPNNGGSPITRYTITPYIGSTAQPKTTITGNPPATSAIITGLTNGQTYAFTITATNNIGTSSPSKPSNPITPTATTTAPVIDPSTPAVTAVPSNVTSIATGMFSPPARSVIYAAFAMDSLSTSPPTTVTSVTNSGTPLTWRLKGRENTQGPGVGGFVEVWWAYNPGAQSGISVTANFSQPSKSAAPPQGAVQIIVLTHAAADQAAAAWGAGHDVSGGSDPTATVTTTAPQSLVLAVANNWDTSQAPTTGAGQTTTLNGRTAVVLNPADRDTFWTQVRSAPVAAAGSVTMADTAPAVRYHMLAWEVRAG